VLPAPPRRWTPLIAYYRQISGEHADWDEFRKSQIAERRAPACASRSNA